MAFRYADQIRNYGRPSRSPWRAPVRDPYIGIPKMPPRYDKNPNPWKPSLPLQPTRPMPQPVVRPPVFAEPTRPLPSGPHVMPTMDDMAAYRKRKQQKARNRFRDLQVSRAIKAASNIAPAERSRRRHVTKNIRPSLGLSRTKAQPRRRMFGSRSSGRNPGSQVLSQLQGARGRLGASRVEALRNAQSSAQAVNDRVNAQRRRSNSRMLQNRSNRSGYNGNSSRRRVFQGGYRG